MNLRKPLGGDTGPTLTRIDAPAKEPEAPATEQGYDPLTSVALLENMRAAATGGRTHWKVPLIGHLPIARQFHVLGILLVLFLVFAALVMALDVRTAAQAAASTATATEMQMLSQRLSSSSTLALQGRPVAFEAVKDTRERFKAISMRCNGAAPSRASRSKPCRTMRRTSCSRASRRAGTGWTRASSSSSRVSSA
jgi:hypothetical protein